MSNRDVPTLEEAVKLLRLVAHQCPSCDQQIPGTKCSQECLDIPKNVATAVAWLSRYDAHVQPRGAAGPGLYYIVDTRSIVGNCAMFWGPDRRGYVCNLDEAGRYSEEDALAQQRDRSTDVAVPCETIDALAVRHVRVDTDGFRGALKMSRDQHGGPRTPPSMPSKEPAVNCGACGKFFTPTFPDDDRCRRCR